jgi:hypothetical protein
MHCTVKDVQERGVFIETRRINDAIPGRLRKALSGYMWLADSDLPDAVRHPGCQFELTFIPHPNGTCSMHVVPLNASQSELLSTAPSTWLRASLKRICRIYPSRYRATFSTTFNPALHPTTEVVWLTLITMLCAQTLIELGITRHEAQHAPWVALTWALTILVVLCCRWVG